MTSPGGSQVTFRSPSGIYPGWWRDCIFNLIVATVVAIWIGGSGAVAPFLILAGGFPLWLVFGLSFDLVEAQFDPEKSSHIVLRTRWRERAMNTDDVLSIRVHTGPVKSLAEGNSPTLKGSFFIRFSGGRRARGVRRDNDGFDRLLSALRAENPRIDVFETRFGTFKQFRKTR